MMHRRQRLGLSLGPIFLRLGLGLTFVWAGLGKVMEQFPVQGEDALVLANLGVITTAPKPAAPATTPSKAPAADPKDAKPATPPAPDHPLPTPDAKPKDKPADKPKESAPPPPKPKVSSVGIDPTSPVFVLAQAARFSAADFAEPVNVRSVHRITLLLHQAANPVAGTDAKPAKRIWPEWAASGRWPVLLAWAAAVTELVGGTLVLFGFLTRFWALGLVGTMLVAAWLTVFGPAIQAGTTRFGILPNYPAFDIKWMTPMWQFMLTMGGLALFFIGPGSMSLDKLLFSKPPPSAAQVGFQTVN